MTRHYEYRWVEVSDPAVGSYFNPDASELNRLGAEGWHVVASYVNTVARMSERQGRVIDHDAAASMEKKKVEGYF